VFNFEKDRGSVSDISSGDFEDKTDVMFLWGISKKLIVCDKIPDRGMVLEESYIYSNVQRFEG